MCGYHQQKPFLETKTDQNQNYYDEHSLYLKLYFLYSGCIVNAYKGTATDAGECFQQSIRDCEVQQ